MQQFGYHGNTFASAQKHRIFPSLGRSSLQWNRQPQQPHSNSPTLNFITTAGIWLSLWTNKVSSAGHVLVSCTESVWAKSTSELNTDELLFFLSLVKITWNQASLSPGSHVFTKWDSSKMGVFRIGVSQSQLRDRWWSKWCHDLDLQKNQRWIQDLATPPVSRPAGVWRGKTHTACCSAAS